MKRFILLSLFTATSLLSSVNDVNFNLENLTPIQLKKIDELSLIGQQIVELQARINDIEDQAEQAFNTSAEDCDQIERKLNEFVKKIEKLAREQKDVRGILTEGASVEDDYELNFLKVLLVRRYFERLKMTRLVQRYEQCLQELLAL